MLAESRRCFLERGFEGTTLSMIATRLGITPAALFRHAATKEDLFQNAMASPPPADLVPLRFLEHVAGSAEPRDVLRQVANTMLPFFRARIQEQVTQYVDTGRAAGRVSVTIPFDCTQHPTPPQQNIDLLEGYLSRSARAGKAKLKHARATALSFISSLHSYLFLSELLKAFQPPVTWDDYLENLLEIYGRGLG